MVNAPGFFFENVCSCSIDSGARSGIVISGLAERGATKMSRVALRT